jgi:hypothetical protein
MEDDGIEERQDDEGRSYWVNTKTSATAWTRQEVEAPAPAAPQHAMAGGGAAESPVSAERRLQVCEGKLRQGQDNRGNVQKCLVSHTGATYFFGRTLRNCIYGKVKYAVSRAADQSFTPFAIKIFSKVSCECVSVTKV